MSKRQKYDFITARFEKGFRPDSDKLWLDMKSLLDKEMPEQRENRRLMLLVLSVLVFTLLCFTASYLFRNNDNLANSVILPLKDKVNPVQQKIDHPNGPVRPIQLSTQSKGVAVQLVHTPEENKAIQHEQIIAGKLNAEPSGTSKGTIADQTTSSVLIPVSKADQPSVKTALLKNQMSIHRQQQLNKFSGPVRPISIKDMDRVAGKMNTQTNAAADTKQIAVTDTKHTVAADSKTITSTSAQVPSAADENSLVADQSELVSNEPVIKNFVPEQINYSHQSLVGLPANKWIMLDNGMYVEKTSLFLPDTTQIAKIRGNGFFKGKFVSGVSINANMPLSSQQMNSLSPSGSESRLFDFLPSVYVQYYFNKKWYLASEVQFAPQYTPELVLYKNTYSVMANKYKEHMISLNKLYYINLPVSLHYQVKQGFYVGAGVQYSYLTRSIMTDEHCTWQNIGGSWKETASQKSVQARGNSNKEKKNQGRGNGNNPNAPAPTPVDTVAQTIRSNDWRFLVDMNYQYRRFNAGVRFNMGISPYVKMEVTGTNGAEMIEDRNKSIMFYLRYNIIDRRKK